MSKVIIGIHGLGNKPPHKLLKKWWYTSIREGLKGIGKYFCFPKFEMIYWADIIYDSPLNPEIKDSKHESYLEEYYTPAPAICVAKDHAFRKKMLDLIERQMDKIYLSENHWAGLDNIADKIIHKYFRDLDKYYSSSTAGRLKDGTLAKHKIRKKVLELILKYEDDEILLVGHSMGSIIAYDVLTLNVPPIQVNTFVTMGSPLGIPVIMRKIAQEQNLTINNDIKLKTPPGVLKKWCNYSDLEDKIASNYNLADDYDANEIGVKAKDHIVCNNYIINDTENHHKSYGYLRTPEFSSTVFEFISGGKPKIILRLLDIINRAIAIIIKFIMHSKSNQ